MEALYEERNERVREMRGKEGNKKKKRTTRNGATPKRSIRRGKKTKGETVTGITGAKKGMEEKKK